MKLEKGNPAHIELLAQALHEAGREAVGLGQTTAGKPRPFVEWAKLEEHVREGRRSQARWLLARYRVLGD